MDAHAVAEIAGIESATLRAWFCRGLAFCETDEQPERNGLPYRFTPKTAGLIVAMSALVRIGFTASAASAMIFGERR